MEIGEEDPPSPQSSVSELSPVARGMFQAIDELPNEEREVFELVRIQGMTHVEAADLLSVAQKTVQRRLNRALLLLTEKLGHMRPAHLPPIQG